MNIQPVAIEGLTFTLTVSEARAILAEPEAFCITLRKFLAGGGRGGLTVVPAPPGAPEGRRERVQASPQKQPRITRRAA